MPKRPRKVDGNQRDIVLTLRKLGALVDDVSSLAGLGYDLVVQTSPTRIWKVEVKNGALPPSARKLTPSEQRQQRLSGEAYVVVSSAEEAVNALYGGRHVRSP